MKLTSNGKLADTPMPEGVRLPEMRPWGSNLLVRVLPFRDRTESGLYLPPARSNEDDPDMWWREGQPPYVGVVEKRGDLCDPAILPGDQVAFLPNAGVSFVDGGERYILIEQAQVLARGDA